MDKTSKHYILILCGGSGPRLWPLSRASNPKQFLNIFGQQSLLSQTINRFSKFVPASNIFIISNQKYLSQLKRDVGKKIPTANIIIEPDKKNTAMAIVYGTAIISQINPQAIITTAPADHFISNELQFKRDLSKAVSLASSQNQIVAIGTPATSPNPSYGYIVPKSSLFIEKPDPVEAIKLIKRGALWNCGIYTFSGTTFTSELSQLQPEYSKLYQQIFTKKYSIKKIYSQSPSLSFDVAISQKTTHLSTIVAKFSWSDVGEWKTIFQKLPKTNDEIAILNQNTSFIQYNSRRCLISGQKNKLIGIVGVNNLAIIDTVDGLLICNIAYDDSYHVRDLVSQMVSLPKLKKYFLSPNDK